MVLIHFVFFQFLGGASASDAGSVPVIYELDGSYDSIVVATIAYDTIVNVTLEYPNKVR